MSTAPDDGSTDQSLVPDEAVVGRTDGDADGGSVGATPTRDWAPSVGDQVAVVAAGFDDQTDGRIIEDFGEFDAHPVDANDTRISDPARRWAVVTAAGDLIFVDTDQLSPAVSRPAET